MLTKAAISGFLLLAAAADVIANDTVVPPAPAGTFIAPGHAPAPPVPYAPAVNGTSVPLAPLSAPATIADGVVPRVPPALVPPAPTMTPNFVPGVAPNAVTAPSAAFRLPGTTSATGIDGTLSPYLFQPSLGTFPYSQSQYNTFSTTGFPPHPHSFSPWTGMHARYPYYSYRRPWYTPGPASATVNIIW